MRTIETKKRTEFQGRNGVGTCTGFSFYTGEAPVCASKDRQKARAFGKMRTTRIYSITSQGKDAVCFIEIPTDEAGKFIRALEDELSPDELLNVRPRASAQLLSTAKAVVDSWTTGDLAGAVNRLEHAIEEEHESQAKEQRVVVIVEDGIVDSVYSDSPATVLVIDKDDHSDDPEVFTLRDSEVEANVVNMLFNSMHDKNRPGRRTKKA